MTKMKCDQPYSVPKSLPLVRLTRLPKCTAKLRPMSESWSGAAKQ